MNLKERGKVRVNLKLSDEERATLCNMYDGDITLTKAIENILMEVLDCENIDENKQN